MHYRTLLPYLALQKMHNVERFVSADVNWSHWHQSCAMTSRVVVAAECGRSMQYIPWKKATPTQPTWMIQDMPLFLNSKTCDRGNKHDANKFSFLPLSALMSTLTTSHFLSINLRHSLACLASSPVVPYSKQVCWRVSSKCKAHRQACRNWG